MWNRSASLALAGSLLLIQSGWAQPGGGGRGPGGPGNPGRPGSPQTGGPANRNQDEAIRRLEKEVTELKNEIKKLQTANRPSSDRRGGPPAFQSRPGAPRGFGSGPGFSGYRGGWSAPGAMGFQNQRFGPPRGFQGGRRGGFGQFQDFRMSQRRFGPGGFDHRGFNRGPGSTQRFGPPARDGFRGPEQRNWRDGMEQRREERGRPQERRPDGNRPNQDRRPPRPPA